MGDSRKEPREGTVTQCMNSKSQRKRREGQEGEWQHCASAGGGGNRTPGLEKRENRLGGRRECVDAGTSLPA